MGVVIEYGQRVQNLPSLFFQSHSLTLSLLPARVRHSFFFFFFPRVSLSQITLPVAHVFSLSHSLALSFTHSHTLSSSSFPLCHVLSAHSHSPCFLNLSLAFALLVTEVCRGEKRDDGGPS